MNTKQSPVRYPKTKQQQRNIDCDIIKKFQWLLLWLGVTKIINDEMQPLCTKIKHICYNISMFLTQMKTYKIGLHNYNLQQTKPSGEPEIILNLLSFQKEQ